MLHSPLAIFGVTLLLTTCLAAFILGDWRERAGAALYLAAYLIANMLSVLGHNQDLSHTLTDIACLSGFVILCWKSAHPWPLWASGAQLVSTMAGVTCILTVHVAKWAYMTVLVLSAYGVLASLLAGVWAATKEKSLGFNQGRIKSAK